MKTSKLTIQAVLYETGHCVFTKNFTIFFSNAAKTGNVQEFEFEKF